MATDTDQIRRIRRDALITREVDTPAMDVPNIELYTAIRNVIQEDTRNNIRRHHPTPTTFAIQGLERKIESLKEMATRELDQVIEDLLPKIQILLHPSHPDYTKEYPTTARIAEEAQEDSPRRPRQQRQGPWAVQKAASDIGVEVKNTSPIQRRHSDTIPIMIKTPAWEPTYRYNTPFQIPVCDAAGWRVPIERQPLIFEHISDHGRFIRRWKNKMGYCYLYLYKRCYRYDALKKYSYNPPLSCLNLSEQYLAKDFEELNMSLE
jgi:hypothetical protein